MEFDKPSVEADDDNSSKEKSSDKKKRRSPRTLGSVAVERKPKAEEREPKKPERGFFSISEDIKKPKEEAAEKSKSESKDESVSEAEAPIDGTLSDQEKVEATQKVGQALRENIETHDPQIDPEAAAGDAPADELLERIENIQPGETIESISEEVADKYELELPTGAEEASEEAVEPEETETEVEPEAETATSEPEEVLAFDRSAELAAAEKDDDSVTPADGSSGTSGPTSGGGGSSGVGGPASGGSGGFRPPTPPFAGGFGVPNGPGGPGGLNPNLYNAAPPVPSTPNSAPSQPEMIDDRASPAVMFLFGGIVGYFIGRRRGRIKTEKKLLPVQKKLEKQVEDLGWQIKVQETRIRKAAVEKVRQQGPSVVEAIAARRAVAVESKPLTELSAEKSRESARQKAPEALTLHGVKSPEHIGHMLMAVESSRNANRLERSATPEKKAELKQTAETANMPGSEKHVETLSREDLLQISEKISVEGTTLRQIFETQLIGERGLRRLIAEHLRGGDLTKALRHEITEREIDFERDPAMRDLAAVDGDNGGTAPTGGGRTALNKMVEKAASNLPVNVQEEMAFHKARANYESEQLQKHQERRQILDITFTVIITSLLAAVIYLAFFRG
ncbi:MAG: hypothetical protein ACXWLH_05145 [Candidatus Saccharimonadales bacterium]